MHSELKNGYIRTVGPCPECDLKGYTDQPLNVCRLCNGGGWFGRYTTYSSTLEPKENNNGKF